MLFKVFLYKENLWLDRGVIAFEKGRCVSPIDYVSPDRPENQLVNV